MILAGLPTTTQLSGILFVTIEPAPKETLLPIYIPPTTTLLEKIVTLSPIVGLPPLLAPTVTP